MKRNAIRCSILRFDAGLKRRRATGALLLACLAAPLAGGATLASEDVFTVTGVAVDETSDTAATAREKAIAVAHGRAFDRLVGRLVPRDQRAGVPRPGAGRIAPLVGSFGIDTEKTSDVRYLATMTFRFRRQAIRDLLQSHGTGFAETRSRPTLVLPVFQDAGALLLWEKPNPWFDAWKEMPPIDGLVPMVLPDGGLTDIRDLGAEHVAAADSGRIGLLARRYETASVTAAFARFVADFRTGRRTLEVRLHRFGDGDPQGDRTLSFPYRRDSDRKSFMEHAARAVVDELEEAWKRRNLIRFGRRGRIVAHIDLDRLSQWIGIRDSLRSVAPVQDVQLIAVSRRAAAVRLEFFGTVDQLRLALAQRDLALAQRSGSWTLRRRASAALSRQ